MEPAAAPSPLRTVNQPGLKPRGNCCEADCPALSCPTTPATCLSFLSWQLREKGKALEWYGKAVLWMEKHKPNDESLRRFRAEAEELIGSEFRIN
jgi:hypothetical protein